MHVVAFHVLPQMLGRKPLGCFIKENCNPRAPQWWEQFIPDPGCISCPCNILVGAAAEALAPEAHSALCTHDLCSWHSCWQPGRMAHQGLHTDDPDNV